MYPSTCLPTHVRTCRYVRTYDIHTHTQTTYYMHVHVRIHTYIVTYHTCIHNYIPTHTYSYTYTCNGHPNPGYSIALPCLAYIDTYIHTYMHTCIHARIHIRKYTYPHHLCVCAHMPCSYKQLSSIGSEPTFLSSR